MIDVEISQLLRLYSKQRPLVRSRTVMQLEEKYETNFSELKYYFEKLFQLGPENYVGETEHLLKEIEQKEVIIKSILISLIEESENVRG